MAATRAMGGMVAILLFVVALAAFVVQSSLTQFVQGELGFRQPFFLLYIAHSSLMVIFPVHLLYLVLTSQKSFGTYISSLKAAFKARLSPVESNYPEKIPFPTARFIGLVLAFSVGINVPGLLWYASVSLTSIGDVTAIWNTNSFWVYVLTVWLYRMKWEMRKLGAVLIASVGVMVNVYGGSIAADVLGSTETYNLAHREGPKAPVLGDMLTIVASVSYAFYQVLYKRYAALPNVLSVVESDDESEESVFDYQGLPTTSDSRSSLVAERRHAPREDQSSPPFGLYANFFTSCLGFATALTLGLGFPVLHWLSIETFTLPQNSLTFWSIVGIASAGVVFNSCFMILLGVWGPVLTSVGNLLTIVLVLITDFIFNDGTITIWSLLGSGMIVAAFGILAFDMMQQPK